MIVIVAIAAGIGIYFSKTNSYATSSQIPPQLPQQPQTRTSFFEVHMEPSNANDNMFGILTEFVNLANNYNVKLTLLFTPQWAEMISKSNDKLSLLNQWRTNGHEIGGHHHGPSTCPWDGYTNLDINGQEFKNRQNKVPCLEFVRASEKYSGNMDNYMELLSKLSETKTITMSDEDVDWPEGALYAAGGRRLEGAISQLRVVIFNGRNVHKLTSAPLEPRKSTVTGMLITIDELKNEYLSEKKGVFGIGAHEVSFRDNPHLYRQWFEFLKEQNSKPKTVSGIIEEK